MDDSALRDLALTLAGEGVEAVSGPAARALFEALPRAAAYVRADASVALANARAASRLGLSGEPERTAPPELMDALAGLFACPGRDGAALRILGMTWVCAAIRGPDKTASGAVLLGADEPERPKRPDRPDASDAPETTRTPPTSAAARTYQADLLDAAKHLGVILDHAASSIFMADASQRFLMANAAFAALFGRTPDALIGQPVHSLLAAGLSPGFLGGLKRALGAGERVRREETILTAQGEQVLLATFFPVMADEMGVKAVCGLATDITGRVRAENALRKSEEKYRLLAENIFDYVWFMDADLRFHYVSPSVEGILGYTPEEYMSLPVEKRYVPDSAAIVRERLASRRRDAAIGMVDAAPSFHLLGQIAKDGRIVHTEVKSSNLYSPAGVFLGVLGVTRDVTDRVLAERELQKSEEKYRSFFENSAEGIFQFLPDGSLVTCNRAMARMLGYASPEELLRSKTDILAKIHVQHKDRMEFLRLLAKQGKALDYEAQVFRADGRKIWISTNARAVLNEAGELLFLEGAARDITARKRAEQERMLLVAAVEQTAEAVVIVDENYLVEYANPAFSSLTGLESASREGLGKAILPFFEETVRRQLFRGRKWSGRVRHVRDDGSEYVAEVLITSIRDEFGRIRNHVMLVRDVTYEIDLEKRLRQAEKLEAIGVLAGGIAHDFNNILTPILLNSELALGDLPEGHALKKPLTDVVHASERARDLVKQILTFSRQRGRDLAPLLLNPLVKETLKLLGGMVEAGVRVIPVLADKDIVVRADPAQMHQVLMNLCLNASQAMREGGGELTVILDETDVAEGGGKHGPFLTPSPGRYARLVVRDTGHGMDPEVADRVFEPFFTTKRPGQGTGMGLAAVHGIVRACGGGVSVETEPGRGSAFTVLLPLYDPENAREGGKKERR